MLAKPFIPAKFDLPMLDNDGKNCDHWSTALTLMFTNRGIWPIVDGTKVCPDPTTDPAAHNEWCLKDREGQLMILLMLKKVGQNCVFCAKSSKKYWDRISSCYSGIVLPRLGSKPAQQAEAGRLSVLANWTDLGKKSAPGSYPVDVANFIY